MSITSDLTMRAIIQTSIIILLTFGSAHSQSLTLTDLIKLNVLNEDEFDTFITTKGFTYDGLENREHANIKSYAYYVNSVKTSYLSKVTYKTVKSQMVSFQTPSTSIYLNIKTELKKIGFIYARKETNDQATFLYYTKDNMELTLVSSTDESRPNGAVKTFYEISISNTVK